MSRDQPQLADATTVDQPLNLQPLRMRAHHERLGHLDAVRVAGREQRSRFIGRERDRLLAQHVLACVGRADRPRYVQMVRQRVVHRLDVGVGE